MSKRTKNFKPQIEAVLFNNSIEIMETKELVEFEKNGDNDRITQLKKDLTDSRNNNNKDGLTAVCLACKRPVFIASGLTMAPHFKHFSPTADKECPWYSKKNMHPNTLRRQQYQGRQVGLEHETICRKIAKAAKLDPRYLNSTLNEYQPPKHIDHKHGRYPDVLIRWEGLPPFAFEVQTSESWHTEISDRSLHYHKEGVSLIWIVAGIDPVHDTIPNTFTHILYRHRNNAFLFDREAEKKSEQEKKLYLSCYLKNNNGSYEPPILVAIDELTVPKVGLPYFEDRVSLLIQKRRVAWNKVLRTLQALNPKNPWDRHSIESLDKITEPQKNSPTKELYEFHYQRFLEQCSLKNTIEHAISELPHSFSITKNISMGQQFPLIRLIAVVFSIILYANNKDPYVTKHENINSFLNDQLEHKTHSIQPYAELIEFMIHMMPIGTTIKPTVFKKIEKLKKTVLQEDKPSENWRIIQYLVPEIFDRTRRTELQSIDELPKWAG